MQGSEDQPPAPVASARLDDAIEALGGDEQLFIRAAEMMLSEAPSPPQKIRDALKTKDYREISLVSHRLVGSIAALCLEELRTTARQLEEKAKGEVRDAVPDLVDRLESEFNAVAGAISHFVEARKGAE